MLFDCSIVLSSQQVMLLCVRMDWLKKIFVYQIYSTKTKIFVYLFLDLRDLKLYLKNAIVFKCIYCAELENFYHVNTGIIHA